MYFAFPAEPSSSLSTLTSLMATTEDRERRRHRKVKKRREREKQTGKDKGKEIKANLTVGIKQKQWDSVQKKPQDTDCY